MDISSSALGVVTSFAVWGIKRFFGTSTLGSYIAAAVVSIVLSLVYAIMTGSNWITALANVFVSSQVTYALIVSELQAKK